jgi:hypothetical protein
VGAGCDGREGVGAHVARTNDADADGEVVWFWRSEAGAQVRGKTLTRLAGDGGNQAMVTGESTKETVTPSRREGRMIWLDLW